MLYIFIFLHQTTTFRMQWQYQVRCISLYSYIKPQRDTFPYCRMSVVYLYIPTSNHNSLTSGMNFPEVVYLYIPTSNHNLVLILIILRVLYIFIFLHQTTTQHREHNHARQLYIFIFLHQTTTWF